MEDIPKEKAVESASSSSNMSKMPTVIVVIGMAGSGKTTMVKSLWTHFNKPAVLVPVPPTGNLTRTVIDQVSQADQKTEITDDTAMKASDISLSSVAEPDISVEKVTTRPKLRTYMINLDPAVTNTPYPVNIDIRDTIKYKEVMKQYKLGPNGAIMTCLNLFATKFDQVHELLAKRAPNLDVIIIDTPGQIEVFNWSASGSIILDTLAISYPTIVLYVLDTARCQSPVTFMSNMMYSCGVLYKTKLPFIMAFNKIDVRSADQCFNWMRSYDEYADDVMKEDSYMASLSRSCGLAMNEFYEGIRSLGVSAATHVGLDILEAVIKESREEYFEQYLPWLDEQRAAVQERRRALVEKSVAKFAKDRYHHQTQASSDDEEGEHTDHRKNRHIKWRLG